MGRTISLKADFNNESGVKLIERRGEEKSLRRGFGLYYFQLGPRGPV